MSMVAECLFLLVQRYVGTDCLLKTNDCPKPCLDFPENAETRHMSLQRTQLIPSVKHL